MKKRTFLAGDAVLAPSVAAAATMHGGHGGGGRGGGGFHGGGFHGGGAHAGGGYRVGAYRGGGVYRCGGGYGGACSPMQLVLGLCGP